MKNLLVFENESNHFSDFCPTGIEENKHFEYRKY